MIHSAKYFGPETASSTDDVLVVALRIWGTCWLLVRRGVVVVRPSIRSCIVGNSWKRLLWMFQIAICSWSARASKIYSGPVFARRIFGTSYSLWLGEQKCLDRWNMHRWHRGCHLTTNNQLRCGKTVKGKVLKQDQASRVYKCGQVVDAQFLELC